MVTALYIMGILMLITGIFVGILAGPYFLLFIISGTVIAIMLFALAKLLENQQMIMAHLQAQSEYLKMKWSEPITCTNCKETYNETLSYCPYCGHSNQS